MRFDNRHVAGNRLAASLEQFKNDKPIVLALPRGGVPIGSVIANKLHSQLDIIIVRKIGSPDNPELGVGAIAENNVQILDKLSLQRFGISSEVVADVIKREQRELQRRVQAYRNGKQLPSLTNRTVIIIDDGLATGATAQAAILSVKKDNPRQIIFASPVCAHDTAKMLQPYVNQIICVTVPAEFGSVGRWYHSFEQVTDGEVITLLQQAARRRKPLVGKHYSEPDKYLTY